MDKNVENVLWTSGWDSTFRVYKLVEKGALVQPFYVLDNSRFSRYKEIETIKLLSNEIINRLGENKGRILDLIVIDKNEIKFNLIQKISYKVLKKRKHLGTQYYWLSCLALKIKNLELSVHSNDFLFLKGRTILKDCNKIGKYAVLNPNEKDFFKKNIWKNEVSNLQYY
ncbi:hypothetical protein RRF68_02485 [Tenacibaculum sp. HL-MS23]|uniref:hypothetical protein n=1 Tax=Tenacibaculum sp. HL-MS23 TaxID=3077734 RepID=UPI0028FC159D|nr:hypothetical protein [Tenacibaculum sp. HL-MS23]WNW02310.1 hypothetical protein RRF68_02485 [Tenacibaculum sp. HL-MS23]